MYTGTKMFGFMLTSLGGKGYNKDMAITKTTWRKQIEKVTFGEPLIACTLSDKELDVEFDPGFGFPLGQPFTAWTETRVLFPICYDGAEWVGSVPRDPSSERTEHQGGY
jgi:hypothetical protein